MADRQAVLVRGIIGRDGAFGILALDGIPLAVTCERTYAVAESQPDGPQYVKIPPSGTGSYTCKRTMFVKGNYETFEITGVVGHTRLLFHCGNFELDSEGCILVGRRFNTDKPGILDSKVGFSQWMYALRGVDTFHLVVRQPA